MTRVGPRAGLVRILLVLAAFALLAPAAAAQPDEGDTKPDATAEDPPIGHAAAARAAGIPIDIPTGNVSQRVAGKGTSIDGWHILEVAGAKHDAHGPMDELAEAAPGMDFESHASGATINVTYVGAWPTAALDAVQYAVDVWEHTLDSPVPIEVTANWANLGSTGILGSAGTTQYWRDFTNAPVPSTFYPVALVNALRGSDINPGLNDINLNINSIFPNWYLGLDGQPPAGQWDLMTVALHELGHGLGFAGSARVVGGLGQWGLGSPPLPTIYDTFAYDTSTSQFIPDFANPSAALATALTGGNIEHRGSLGQTGNNGVFPKLYAPGSWQQGSSYSHLDEATFVPSGPDPLMTPSIGSGQYEHEVGWTHMGMYEDWGWPTVAWTSLKPLATPYRTADTRTGIGGVPVGKVAPGTSIDVQIEGVGGVPSSDVISAVVNITGTGPMGATDLRAFPAGESVPSSSNLNLVAGETFANLAVVKVGAGGEISVYNSTSSTHIIVDIMGYYVNDSSYDSGKAYPVTPTRIADTRNNTGNVGSVKVGPQTEIDVQVTGVGGVPSNVADVEAVMVNITAAGPSAASFLKAWPEGGTRPATSNLNMVPGQTIPNLALVGVGPTGQITIRNAAGFTHVIVDVVAWYGRTDPNGADHHPISPARILDTRIGSPVGPGASIDLQIAGEAGIEPSDIKVAYLNVTAIATAGTDIRLYPSGGSVPGTSNLNLVGGETFPNLVAVAVGDDGKVSIRNAAGNTHVIVDLVGYDRR